MERENSGEGILRATLPVAAEAARMPAAQEGVIPLLDGDPKPKVCIGLGRLKTSCQSLWAGPKGASCFTVSFTQYKSEMK